LALTDIGQIVSKKKGGRENAGNKLRHLRTFFWTQKQAGHPMKFRFEVGKGGFFFVPNALT
jgi:ribosomal protein L15